MGPGREGRSSGLPLTAGTLGVRAGDTWRQGVEQHEDPGPKSSTAGPRSAGGNV